MSCHTGETWNEYMNYCDDDKLLVDWFNENMNKVAWQMFKNQKDWLYLNGELGKNKNGSWKKPQIKSYEKFNEAFNDAIHHTFGWMFNMMKMEYLRKCSTDDITLDMDSHWLLSEYMDTYYYGNDDEGEGRDE